MHFSPSLLLLADLLVSEALAQATYPRSSKRGLVFVPAAEFPADDKVWIQPSSDLTWYYNYIATPSPQYVNVSSFEFIPMMWGAPANDSDNIFLNTVKGLIANGTKVQHVFSFNEPDGPFAEGGSQIDASPAAAAWQREILPLQKLGIKVGAPAVTQRGQLWLSQFFGNCTGCKPDFIPLHFYGDYAGFEAYVSGVVAAYPNTSIWITEYADNDVSLEASQDFFNKSASYLDSSSFIERYSYFGAFRSTDSNVGPNAAMLTAAGLLTDIGSWYLGGPATNMLPSGAPGSHYVPWSWGSVLLGSIIGYWIFAC